MNRSTTFHLTLTSFIVAGFLYYYNSQVHDDYNKVIEEVKYVDDQLDRRLDQSSYNLEVLSKKKMSFVTILEDHKSTIHDARFSLNHPSIISEGVLKIDKEKLKYQLSPFYIKAITIKDSILAHNYLKMAIIERTQQLIDSLQNNTTAKYTTSIITFNEPNTYHIGASYPLYFSSINTLTDSEKDKYQIIKNGKKVHLKDFPLRYSIPQKEQYFQISGINKYNNFHFGQLHTKNHESNRTLKP